MHSQLAWDNRRNNPSMESLVETRLSNIHCRSCFARSHRNLRRTLMEKRTKYVPALTCQNSVSIKPSIVWTITAKRHMHPDHQTVNCSIPPAGTDLSNHFFPLFLIPCAPVLRGPLLPFAFAASSALAFASIDTSQRICPFAHSFLRIPAFCFSWNALSSSSSSPFGAFFGAFKGFALPPVVGLVAAHSVLILKPTGSVNASHFPVLFGSESKGWIHRCSCSCGVRLLARFMKLSKVGCGFSLCLDPD